MKIHMIRSTRNCVCKISIFNIEEIIPRLHLLLNINGRKIQIIKNHNGYKSTKVFTYTIRKSIFLLLETVCCKYYEFDFIFMR